MEAAIPDAHTNTMLFHELNALPFFLIININSSKSSIPLHKGDASEFSRELAIRFR